MEIPSQEGFISVTGGRVWYRIVGTGSHIPLLTLHGGPGAYSDYLEPLTALADERPVIFYDQLGGGKADRPDNPNLWTLDRSVEELKQVRDALNLTRFHLYGQSSGTIFAIEYAIHQPDGLVSLTLDGPVMSITRYLQDVNALKRDLPFEMQAAIDQNEAVGTLDAPEYQVAIGEWMRQHVCRNKLILDGFLKQAADPITGLNPQVCNAMMGLREFSAAGNLKDFDRTARLSEINVPTLFTCGRYDKCTPDTTAWYQSLLPSAEMVVFEKSAHMTILEEPDRYVQTLRDFLHKVEGKGALVS
jgi:proline-specific peptidase